MPHPRMHIDSVWWKNYESKNWRVDNVDNDGWNVTSSTAQGGGGSFKNRKPIGEIGCCE